MAKDDYDVVLFKVLVYLYSVFRRKAPFIEEGFFHAVGNDCLPDGYLEDVLHLMSDEGLIKGAGFVKVWGEEYLLYTPLSDLEITHEGIQYLKENSVMEKLKNYFLEHPGVITSMIIKVL
jgi:hypothetical protein